MICIRTIALAAPLLVLVASGCGGAAPPADAPERTAGTGSSSGTRGGSFGADAPDESKPDRDDATRNSEEGSPGSPAPPPPPGNPITDGGPKRAGAMSTAQSQGGSAPHQSTVDASSNNLSGRLTQNEIGAILTKNAAFFDDCYTVGAGASQSFTGVVTVKATLGPSGAVTDAQVVKSTAKNQKVDTCVIQAFKKIKFPAPKDGGTSVITFPMEFNGIEQVR